MGDEQNGSSSNNKSGGLKLIPHQLSEDNYMIWRCAMMIALKTKNKLGFMDGSIKQPVDRASDAFLSWSFVDSAMTGWLLHSMKNELYEAYMFTPTARQIWKELEEKYGQTNRPQLLHVKKHMAMLERGNDSVAVYSTKLKKLWEEFCCLRPRPNCICVGCDCGAFKTLEETYESDYVDQFLMGLGEAYENVVDNILVMEPVPSFNKVYAMVKRVEQQRTISSTSTVESSALLARVTDKKTISANSANLGFRAFDRKKEKAKLYCTYCNRTGHTEDGCFKKIGYPD
ncbi:uncharacterized protein G2W53_016306 [Senna tora]|uniref:Retrotransposon Copia-like N-terminal domain-containing protein n=1 Tax=Senna tora TaxID=362788 RepID=A0A834WJF7_9FABA|nr:uncharacterized protein G2W53_016306 [Senna tora]